MMTEADIEIVRRIVREEVLRTTKEIAQEIAKAVVQEALQKQPEVIHHLETKAKEPYAH